MSVETMAKLYELKNIIGVKDATGDLNRVSQQLKSMGKEFIQLTGNVDNALEFNKRGGVGAIGVTANVAAKLASEFQKACVEDISKAEVFDKAPSGRLYVDGNVAVEEDSKSIKERRNISANGILDVTILVTPKGNIHKNPIITFKGIPIYETDEFIFELEEEIEKTTRTFKLGNKNQKYNLIDTLKNVSRKFVKEKTGKRPFTNINLVNI